VPTPLAQLAHTSLLISVFLAHRLLLALLPDIMDGLRDLEAHLGACRHPISIARIAFVFVKAVYRYTNMAFHFRIHVTCSGIPLHEYCMSYCTDCVCFCESGIPLREHGISFSHPCRTQRYTATRTWRLIFATMSHALPHTRVRLSSCFQPTYLLAQPHGSCALMQYEAAQQLTKRS